MNLPTLSLKQWKWMGITFVIYSFLVGWPLAAAIVLTVSFHEYCHLLMAHKLRMKTKGFTLIPFIGGMAFISSNYKTLWRQAQVVLAGPLGGALLSFITFAIYLMTRSPWLGTVAFWMGVMNLGNLCPASFLDGGQLTNTILYSINRKIGMYVMFATTIIGSLLIGYINPILGIFVLIFGLLHCRREYNNQKNFELGNTWLCTEDFLNKPFPLNKKQIIKVALIWSISTLVLVIYCLILNHLHLSNTSLLVKV
jgi:Zn-dependent protease